MPGLACTLAQKAKKLQKGMGVLTKFFSSTLMFICRPQPCQFSWLQKKKITGIRCKNTELDNHSSSSAAPTSVTSTLPLEATPFDSLLEGYSDQLAELSQPEVHPPSRTFTENGATSAASGALLPKLVYPLMAQQHWRKGGEASSSELSTTPRCSFPQQEAKVLVVSFTSTYGSFYHVSATERHSNNPHKYSTL